MRTWAIVVAAGEGARFGAPKQFVRLGGVSVLERAVDVARESCEGVVVVLAPGAEWDAREGVLLAVGGATRSDSVRAGLAAVPDDVDVIVVHDAARPLASRRLFELVVRAVADGADGAVPGLPVADTLKRVDDEGRVVETVSRAGLVAVQTPQAFRAHALRAAHRTGADDTDDAALIEANGGVVVVVEGERRNLKLTLADDLELAQALLDGARRVGHRSGLGFDVHPFGDAPPLVLGGVRIADAPRLAGHSDGDAIAHAVADALLGPTGLPDLGTLFPASDDQLKDADSMAMLRDVVLRVEDAGWWVDNVDVVVVAERPVLAPHVDAMVANLAGALARAREPMGVEIGVAVRPKRAEGLGAIGRAEGIAVWAVASLSQG